MVTPREGNPHEMERMAARTSTAAEAEPAAGLHATDAAGHQVIAADHRNGGPGQDELVENPALEEAPDVAPREGVDSERPTKRIR